MKRKISEIMEDMDKLEKIEITDELIEKLKDHFKDEIASDKKEKSENEKVAQGSLDNIIQKKIGNTDHGQSDRV